MQYPTKEAFDMTDKSAQCSDLLIQEGSEFHLYNTKLVKVPGANPLTFKNLDEYVTFIEWQRTQGISCPILYMQRAFNAQDEPVYKIRPNPLNMQGGMPDLAQNVGQNVGQTVGQTVGQNVAQNVAVPTDPPPCKAIKGPQLGVFNLPDISASASAGPGATASLGAATATGGPGATGISAVSLSAASMDAINNKNSYPAFDPHGQDIGMDTPLDQMFRDNNNEYSPNPMDTNWGGSNYTAALVKSGFYKDNEVTRQYTSNYGQKRQFTSSSK